MIGLERHPFVLREPAVRLDAEDSHVWLASYPRTGVLFFAKSPRGRSRTDDNGSVPSHGDEAPVAPSHVAQQIVGGPPAGLIPPVAVTAVHDRAFEVTDRHEPLTAPRDSLEVLGGEAVRGHLPAISIAAVHHRGPAVTPSHGDKAFAVPDDPAEVIEDRAVIRRDGQDWNGRQAHQPPAIPVDTMHDYAVVPHSDEAFAVPGYVVIRELERDCLPSAEGRRRTARTFHYQSAGADTLQTRSNAVDYAGLFVNPPLRPLPPTTTELDRGQRHFR